VFWAQGVVCFLLWIGYGAIQARRSDKIRAKMSALGRGTRATLGGVLMIGGAAVLIAGGVVIEQIGGFTKTGMTALGWLVVAVVGLVFVHAQTMSFAMLVSLAQETVTNSHPSPSDHHNAQGTNHDEASPNLP
jgi:hypothetical protein